MKDAWGDVDKRQLEQIEMIDIRSADDLKQSWQQFICRRHYFTCTNFYDSYAAFHPRRSCDDFWQAIMMNNPQPDRPIPRDASWEELDCWFRPLIEQEQAK
jgi:hypothetical protein